LRALADTAAHRTRAAQRRLALGAAGTALFVALSLRPDSAPPPSKPLFFYLVPLLRVQALLTRAEAVVADADWVQLASLRRAILGSPNDVRITRSARVLCVRHAS
jgi:A/G-specific adenine glycosylase